MKTPTHIDRINVTAMFAVLVILLFGSGSSLFAQLNLKLPASKPQAPNRVASKPRATFDRVWIDYDVVEGGKRGMRVHAAFSLFEMKNKDCVLLFTFQDGEGPLVDMNREYEYGGNVAVSRKLKPAYSPAVYQDLDAFIPYSEFELEDGKYSLKIDVDVVYPNGDLLEHLTFHDFDYSQGNRKVEKSSDVSVDFISKSVDYDITRDGRKGMMLHVKLDNVKGLKGVGCSVLVRIMDSADKYIMGDTAEYSDGEGNFEAVFGMKPAYDPAKYDDIQIFIPYSEISVGKGTHKLKLDIDLFYDSGEFIRHLEFHPFDFKR